MSKLEAASSKRRSRAGDFLAALLLLAIIAGTAWLWWRQRHGPSSKPAPPAAHEPARHQVIPSLVLVERTPDVSGPATAVPTNEIPVPGVSNAVPAILSAPVKEPGPMEFPRPAASLLEAQVALARRVISPGCIDGAMGSQTRTALAVFQALEKLPQTRAFDTNTQSNLKLDEPVLTDYVVSSNDLARLQPLGKTWLEKSRQTALDYETILELVAEKSHAHTALIEKLNPGVDWARVAAGTVLKVPAADYPPPADRAAYVVIHLSARFLEAFDTETNLIAHFPCSIAAKVEKRPVGELHVAVVAPNPNYTFNPEIFPESAEAQAIGHKLVIPAGPKNPVGVAWIGLDRPGYGIHGSPNPEQIGRTESHGCFRLANWDAAYLLKLVWIGMPVFVEP